MPVITGISQPTIPSTRQTRAAARKTTRSQKGWRPSGARRRSGSGGVMRRPIWCTIRRAKEEPMPESVPSSLIIDAFKEIFQSERRGAKRQDPLGWIISVPDTHQKSVLAALDKERSLPVLTCSTEDDANAVAAGLYMTGEPVIVMIQHAGLYAS